MIRRLNALALGLALVTPGLLAAQESTGDKAERKVEGAAATVEQKSGQAWDSAKQALYDAMNKSKLVIDFAKGSSKLSDGEASDIKALFGSLDAGIGRDVVLAAWSDKDLPKDNAVTLSAADRKLAAARVKAVEAYLKKAKIKAKVVSYNMAQQPNALERMVSTKNTEVKEAAKGANDTVADRDPVAEILRDNGGAGKAVLVIRDQAVRDAH